MCGLTGIITNDGREPEHATLVSMNAVQAHRGPDQEAAVVLPGAGLAHRRLTILDAANGRQPMRSSDGRYTLIYNGEIYNFRALNQELAAHGYVFKGHCDSETLLKAWQCWGEDCIARIRGMFAFAIWDASKQKLHLVRDRLGIKPIYYGFTTAGDFVFGSELKSLTAHPQVGRALEPRAVENYLALGYVPDPYAIYKGIYKLPAGHSLNFDRGSRNLITQQYWDVSFADNAANGGEDLAAALYERLAKATHMRLVSDVPLGAFLSGGVDSSAIVSLMAAGSDATVTTCGIGFEHGGFDESSHARDVAAHLGTTHHEHRISGDDFDLVDRLIDIYDEPFADSSALPTYRVCQLARQQVKVALSGDGGDENFAGYRRHRMHWAESRARARVPPGVRQSVFGALGRAYPKMDWAPRPLRAKTTFQSLAMDTAGAYCNSVSMLPHGLREQLYSRGFKRELAGYRAVDLFREHAANATTEHPLSLAQYLDFKTYLPGDILTKVDRASMAHGLEVRVPMLDHEFVTWAAGIAPHHKLHRGEGKHMLKRAFEPSLPHEILYRRKQGFSVPLADWFNGPLRDTGKRALTDSALTECGMFDAKALASLWQAHTSGRKDHGTAIWSLLMLSRFLERAHA